MPAQPTPGSTGLPGIAPAILPRICLAAGWTQEELLLAVAHGLRTRGSFSSVTASVPHGIAALPSAFPAFDIRATTAGLAVELLIGPERVSCLGGGVATMTLGALLPATIMLSATGRPVAHIVHHGLIDSLDFVITGMDRARWHAHTTIAFTMPDRIFPA